MTDITAIYYTGNFEEPIFEKRVGEALVESAGDTPIISVSQKPMDLGNNICVGDVGISTQNGYVQMLIGCEIATTKWVCLAPADFMFPPEYFQFCPPRDDTFYVAKPLWVFFNQRGKRRVFVMKPRGSEAAMVCDRRLLIERIRTILKPIGGSWGPYDSGDKSWPYLIYDPVVKKERFDLENPCVMVKTDNQMHRRTPHNRASATNEIPYWGTVEQFLGRFFS